MAKYQTFQGFQSAGFNRQGSGLNVGGSGVPPPEERRGSGATPGTYDVNIFDPLGTATRAKEETEDLFAGLKNAVFGMKTPDAEGKHGGLLGGIPVVGDLGRAVSHAIGDVAGAAIGAGGGALDLIGGGLEQVDFRSDDEKERLRIMWEALPNGDPAKERTRMLIENEPQSAGHHMSAAIAEYRESLLAGNDPSFKPKLTDNLFVEVGSAADVVTNLFGWFDLGSRHVQRGVAGAAKADGLNRLQAIVEVGSGRAVMNEDKGVLGTGFLAGPAGNGLDHIEAITYQRFTSGAWTEDEALDFLASHNAGYSSVLALQLAGVVFLDPLNVAAMSTVGISKFVATGAKLAMRAQYADSVVTDTKAALALARAAGDDVTELAAKLAKDEKLAVSARNAMRLPGERRRENILGRLAESNEVTDVVRALYKVYEPMQAAGIGKAAKVVRTILDPLSALGGRRALPMTDVLSTAGTRMAVGVYGDGNFLTVHRKLYDLTPNLDSKVADQFSADFGTYSANLIIRVLARRYRQIAISAGNAEALKAADPYATMEAAMELRRGPKKHLGEMISEEANRHRRHEWDDIQLDNLATRLERQYGNQSKAEWRKLIDGMNADERGLLHAATYGRVQTRLLDGVKMMRMNGETPEWLEGKDLIVINKQTLTMLGADGIIKRMDKARGKEKRYKIWQEAQKRYPELRGLIIDKQHVDRDIERIIDDLRQRMHSLPMQVKDAELKQLPEYLSELHGADFTLAIAPDMSNRWNLHRSNVLGGKLDGIGEVFVDHRAPGHGIDDIGIRPLSHTLATNVAGVPIPDALVKLARPLDHLEVAINTMKRGVTGTLIADTARLRFIEKAVHKYGEKGITQDVATDIIRKLDKAVRDGNTLVRPSGMLSSHMWAVAQDALPKNIPASDFNRRDLLSLVLDAYQGDLRHVGVTQVLSSRVKRVLAMDQNMAGHIAESIYPTLKFRMNVVFQWQEKVEPWLLNSWRGIIPARGSKMNAADRETQRLFESMYEHSLVSNADVEMAEQAAYYHVGRGIEAAGEVVGTPLHTMRARLGLKFEALKEVKGVKRVNMLRTFRHGLGKQLREAYDTHMPGLWDDMYMEAQRKAGRQLDEDEFAVSLMAENLLGNDVIVRVFDDRMASLGRQYDLVDFNAAIDPGMWLRPQSLGELQTLDLDSMVRRLDLDPTWKTAADVRRAIAAGETTVEDVIARLKKLGNVHPDYALRAQRSLEFSWNGFWRTLEREFAMTRQQSEMLQDMIGTMADMRKMTPVDYMSQIFHPYLARGAEGAMGELGRLAQVMKAGDRAAVEEALRAGKRVYSESASSRNKSLAKLATVEGGTFDDLINQFAAVFSHHLDPSAKRALLIKFKPELQRRFMADGGDLNLIDELWDKDAEKMFAEYTRATLHPEILRDADIPRMTPDEFELAHSRTLTGGAAGPMQPEKFINQHGRANMVRQIIGPGIRAADPELQNLIMDILSRTHQQFPNLRIRHIDIADASKWDSNPATANDAIAFVLGGTSDDSSRVIILNEKFFGADWRLESAKLARDSEAARYATTASHTLVPGGPRVKVPRRSFMGVPWHTVSGIQGTVQHEVGHLLDGIIRSNISLSGEYAKANTKRLGAVQQWIEDEYLPSAARRLGSEYSMANEKDAIAELIALAFTPGVDLDALMKLSTLPVPKSWEVMRDPLNLSGYELELWWERFATDPQNRKAMLFNKRFRSHKEEMDNHFYEWEKILLNDEGYAASTVRRKKAELRKREAEIKEEWQREVDDGVLRYPDPPRDRRGEMEMGPFDLKQMVLDFRKHLEDAGEYVPWKSSMDPDIASAVDYFNQWMKAVIGSNLKQGGHGVLGDVLRTIDGLPAGGGKPFNQTENLLLDTVGHSMQAKWQDAHRLQYYSKNRSMLERSINHPMFGLYPASYMWGKILPELIRFVALEPFGLRTGALAYGIEDAMRAMALQHEYDPEFQQKMEELGHSAAFFALNYMVPAVPWEVNSNWSGWVREFGRQGLDMEARAESGGTVDEQGMLGTGLDPSRPIQRATDMMNPTKAFNRTVIDPVKEVTGGDKGLDTGPDGLVWGTGEAAAETLGNPLEDAMTELSKLFGGE